MFEAPVNSAPYDLNSSSSLTVTENQPAGTIVGEFNATDPDANATLTYHLVSGAGDTHNTLFTLETNGTLRTATTFDYETNASTYTIRVQVRDEYNATAEENFTVTLMDVYEVPVNSAPADLNSTAPLTIAENEPLGTIVGEFNATDPDANTILSYHLVSGAGDTDNSLFALDTNGTLRSATTFDYETNASTYTIRVQARDEFNATVENTFTVTLTDDQNEGSHGDGNNQTQPNDNNGTSTVTDNNGTGVIDDHNQTQVVDGNETMVDHNTTQPIDHNLTDPYVPVEPLRFKPFVKTEPPIEITTRSARLQGILIDDGNATITEYGFVISDKIYGLNNQLDAIRIVWIAIRWISRKLWKI